MLYSHERAPPLRLTLYSDTHRYYDSPVFGFALCSLFVLPPSYGDTLPLLKYVCACFSKHSPQSVREVLILDSLFDSKL